MAAKTIKTTPRRITRRRAASQKISDRRYYVQCSYRLAMFAMSLIALYMITHNGG